MELKNNLNNYLSESKLNNKDLSNLSDTFKQNGLKTNLSFLDQEAERKKQDLEKNKKKDKDNIKEIKIETKKENYYNSKTVFKLLRII